MALIHGGQLQQVATQYKIPVDDWLDLSTGIAPRSYPIPDIPLALWQQLPQKNEALLIAAKAYYQCSQQVLVTNGSQSIIKALPMLWTKKNTPQNQASISGFSIGNNHAYLPERGYKEHGQAWQDAGYQLHFYQDKLPAIESISPQSVLVIINPNNPTGKLFSHSVMMQYQQVMTALKGLLVVDEAFIDVVSTQPSMGSFITNEHTLVLRSFGKFFGLAGIRLGFLLANDTWKKIFSDYLGPWQVNGPAQFIAEKALADVPWQVTQKQNLANLKLKQTELLMKCWGDELIEHIHGCDLFITIKFKPVAMNDVLVAKKLYHYLCQQGVYVRLADEQDTLRFGIALAKDLPRLEQALLMAKQQLFV